jgi:hypothetical protein
MLLMCTADGLEASCSGVRSGFGVPVLAPAIVELGNPREARVDTWRSHYTSLDLFGMQVAPLTLSCPPPEGQGLRQVEEPTCVE